MTGELMERTFRAPKSAGIVPRIERRAARVKIGGRHPSRVGLIAWRLLLLASMSVAASAIAQAPDPAAAVERYETLFRETGNAGLLWLIAETHARAGNDAQAIRAFERAASANIGLVPDSDSALNRLRGNPDFDRILARVEAGLARVRRDRQIASIQWPGLVPEGIAVDPGSNRIFVGDSSNRAIIEVTADGRSRRFASLPLRPLGMAVDAERGLLWVATTEAFWTGPQQQSALVALDLRTGRVRRSASGPELRSLNDLVVASDGTIFATDSLGGAVFRLAPGESVPVRVPSSTPMSYPNGIALSADERYLFVAQGIAIRRLEIATGEQVSLAQPPSLALIGIDGLYRHGDRLIAVQNVGTPGRVLLLNLSADQRSIARFSLLDAANPEVDLPTTAAVNGDRLILLANSQLRRLGNDGQLTSGPPLQPIRLLEIAVPRETAG